MLEGLIGSTLSDGLVCSVKFLMMLVRRMWSWIRNVETLSCIRKAQILLLFLKTKRRKEFSILSFNWLIFSIYCRFKIVTKSLYASKKQAKKKWIEQSTEYFFSERLQGHSQILTFIKLINKDKKIKFEAC